MSREDGGQVLAAGTLPPGHRQGVVVVPLRRPFEESSGGIRTCVATGPGARTVLYGAGGKVRLEWLREGDESWFALLPTIAHRFGLGKGISIGDGLLVLAALLMLGAWALALRLALRELTP
jgi:hypothetical protein